MKMFIDTTGDSFVLGLFDDNNYCIDSILIENVPKKVDLLTSSTEKILKNNNIDINQISDFYLNLGPGYFTGVRISLVYVRTIALITGANIHTTSSMQLLQKQLPTKPEFIINASGSKVYLYKNINKTFDPKNIEILDNDELNFDVINYTDIINNFNKYIELFTENDNLIDIEPYYIKKPQIGGK
ncbi:tRNA (adenosine(37)-N6)-threonylcarbamoyltransferase complex dimerization subunit type 1 TsaB [Mycoplasma sp. CSL7475-4]|uniref:tRNA (adenosine(37)-N6)-threonylcarbamoyltransferase complex dimerization subunit type 1 TsaB n=1 Tax=Mycoplasma sp. CSL7475-4 TaxID=2973942 RepID=UPI00216AF993|nr:tRNA (adenosine(37)-N6)-threonylcarbamoyltransferase complex dimerization subunit type 1 TsaB [Mycoplasma sp. CSL7475-4]MCS4536951.1 tRNA (adenosine(37)-N6)-threonylcarbamoyltransferase complex dimerization subunit type 1 TsaB [Mycoplasma sp. CSL7475-4]